MTQDEVETVEALIREGVECAQRVVKRWEHGDLAEAVNMLEDWAEEAKNYLPEFWKT